MGRTSSRRETPNKAAAGAGAGDEPLRTPSSGSIASTRFRFPGEDEVTPEEEALHRASTQALGSAVVP